MKLHKPILLLSSIGALTLLLLALLPLHAGEAPKPYIFFIVADNLNH